MSRVTDREHDIDLGRSPAPRRPSVRQAAAAATGRAATAALRAAGRAGGMLGGRLALALDPSLLAQQSAGRRIALVTGTNGKSTTTNMLATALTTRRRPAWNSTGANMPDGMVAALLDSPGTTEATLEIDEFYVPRVIEAVRPAVLVLLNLSRDQLDRAGEVEMLAKRIRSGLALHPEILVVANAVDPVVVAAVSDISRVVWVQPAHTWNDDATTCPRCSAEIRFPEGGTWACSNCDFAQPKADWTVTAGVLHGPDGETYRTELQLPGLFNDANAAFAMAAAADFGIAPADALSAIRTIPEVGGRYRTFPRPNGRLRLLLAKNPAGWGQTLAMVEAGDDAVVIVVNSREADGRDPSWLWDVPFERLQGRRVVASGDRATDVAVRLAYADVECTVEPDPLRAADTLGGTVDVVADYTSFARLRGRLQAPAAE